MVESPDTAYIDPFNLQPFPHPFLYLSDPPSSPPPALIFHCSCHPDPFLLSSSVSTITWPCPDSPLRKSLSLAPPCSTLLSTHLLAVCIPGEHTPYLPMDFEHSKSPTNFIDSMDTAFTYMDNGLDYLHPYGQSPSFGVPIGRRSNVHLRHTTLADLLFLSIYSAWFLRQLRPDGNHR
jgi:hypothetical protein